MPNLTPSQKRNRARVEELIGLMAPALDAVLAVGERISRIAEREDFGYYPARRPDESEWGPHARALGIGSQDSPRETTEG